MKPKWLYSVWTALAVVLLTGAAPARATEVLTFIHTDVAGSPVAATDINGDVIWREGYRPYGVRTKNESAAAVNRQFFHGKAFDADTGLSYFGARYYDPFIGRFMGVDAVGFDEENLHSFNRYAYGNNNPYKYLDTDGRMTDKIIFFGVAYGLATAWGVYNSSQKKGGTSSGGKNDISGSSGGQLDPCKGLGICGDDGSGGSRGSAKTNKNTDQPEGSTNVVREPNRIYSAQELARRAEEPGPMHNFPQSFDKQIFSEGQRRVVSDTYVQYELRGSMNRRAGTYEIGVRPSESGRTEVVVHRFFRPD